MTNSPQAETPKLAYASPTVAKAAYSPYRAAISAGVMPLVLTSITTILYALTQWQALFMIGLAMVLMTGICLLVGLLCLSAYMAKEWRTRGHSWELYRRILVVLVLYIVNVPAALATLQVGEYFRSFHTITVTNNTSTPIGSFVLVGFTLKQEIGPIAPGATVSRRLRLADGQPLNYVAISGGNTSTDCIEYYVVNNGAGYDVSITSSGPVVKQRY